MILAQRVDFTRFFILAIARTLLAYSRHEAVVAVLLASSRRPSPGHLLLTLAVLVHLVTEGCAGILITRARRGERLICGSRDISLV